MDNPFEFDTEPNKWVSPIVNEYAKFFDLQKTLHEKLNFLITGFLQWRKEHTMGEYDFMVVLDEEIEEEREEISRFFVEKFEIVKNELSEITGKNFEKFMSADDKIDNYLIFHNKLVENLFLELKMVKILTVKKKDKLIELIFTKKMPYAIAMFDYLGFCDFLDNEKGTKYKANEIISRMFNDIAKDGTSAKHYRRSLIKPSERYNSHKFKETVIKDYQKLK
jgi:hypothetical protein